MDTDIGGLDEHVRVEMRQPWHCHESDSHSSMLRMVLSRRRSRWRLRRASRRPGRRWPVVVSGRVWLRRACRRCGRAGAARRHHDDLGRRHVARRLRRTCRVDRARPAPTRTQFEPSLRDRERLDEGRRRDRQRRRARAIARRPRRHRRRRRRARGRGRRSRRRRRQRPARLAGPSARARRPRRDQAGGRGRRTRCGCDRQMRRRLPGRAHGTRRRHRRHARSDPSRSPRDRHQSRRLRLLRRALRLRGHRHRDPVAQHAG